MRTLAPVISASARRRSGGGSGGGTWLPLPPSASLIKPTGTITFSPGLANPTSITYGLFHTDYQHIVCTSTGIIFAVYSSADNGNHDPSTWELRRCNNLTQISSAAQWSLVANSNSKGYPQYGVSPSIEIDENDNIYVIANYLPQLGESFKSTTIYKYTPADNYTNPTIKNLTNNYAAGKSSTFLDQSRKWIWIVYWSDRGSTQNLIAVDYNGNLVYSRNIWPAYNNDWAPGSNASTDLHAASAHYHSLWVSPNGRLYLGWSSLAFQSPTTSFYSERMAYSDGPFTGSETWMGPASGSSGPPSARTFPLCVDDSGVQSRLAWEICKTSNITDEFIPASNGGYWNGSSGKFNYNRHKHMVYNGGRIHWFYESENDGDSRIVGPHQSYAAFDLSTFTAPDSLRRTPHFAADLNADGDRLGGNVGQSGGNFVQDTTQEGRLYWVMTDSSHRLRVLRSDDHGTSWYVYASNTAIAAQFATSAFRWVLNDGSLVGITMLENSPGTIYAFRVTPN